MAIRRRASDVGPSDFAVFADDLAGFEEEDIAAACDAIGREERGEGELAFPSMPTLMKRIRKIAAERRYVHPNAELDAMRADREANPDNYVPVNFTEMIAELAERKKLDPNAPMRKPVDTEAAESV